MHQVSSARSGRTRQHFHKGGKADTADEQQLPKLSKAARGFRPTRTSGVWFNGTLLTFGGLDDGVATDNVHYLPLLTTTHTGWTHVHTSGLPPSPRMDPLLFLHEQQLYVMGGVDSDNGASLDDAHVLNLHSPYRMWNRVNLELDWDDEFLPNVETVIEHLNSAQSLVIPVQDTGVYYLVSEPGVTKLNLSEGKLTWIGEIPAFPFTNVGHMMGCLLPVKVSARLEAQVSSGEEESDEDEGQPQGRPKKKESSGRTSDVLLLCGGCTHAGFDEEEHFVTVQETLLMYLRVKAEDVTTQEGGGSEESVARGKYDLQLLAELHVPCPSKLETQPGTTQQPSGDTSRSSSATSITTSSCSTGDKKKKHSKRKNSTKAVEPNTAAATSVVERHLHLYTHDACMEHVVWHGRQSSYELPIHLPDCNEEGEIEAHQLPAWHKISLPKKKRNFVPCMMDAIFLRRTDGSIVAIDNGNAAASENQANGEGEKMAPPRQGGTDSGFTLFLLSEKGMAHALPITTDLHTLPCQKETAASRIPHPPPPKTARVAKTNQLESHPRSDRGSGQKAHNEFAATTQAPSKPQPVFWDKRNATHPNTGTIAKNKKSKAKQQALLNRQILHNLLEVVHPQDKERSGQRELYRLLQGVSEDTKMLNLSSCPPLACNDLFVVREVLSLIPSIIGLDLTNHQFGEVETQMVLSILVQLSHIRLLALQGCTFTPVQADEDILRQLDYNAKLHEDKKLLRSEGKEKRRRKKSIVAQHRHNELERKQEVEREEFVESESCPRLFVEQQEGRSYIHMSDHTYRVWHRQTYFDIVKSIKKYLLVKEQLAQQRVKLWDQQLRKREVEEKGEAKARTAFHRQERSAMRVIKEREREIRRIEKLIENLFKTEESRRYHVIRLDQQTQREHIEKKKRDYHDDVVVPEMRRRWLEEQRKILHAKLLVIENEEEEARPSAALEVAQEHERFLCILEQLKVVVLEFYGEIYPELLNDIMNPAKKAKEQLEREENLKLRTAQREAVNGIPPTMKLNNSVTQIPVALGSSEPIAVVRKDPMETSVDAVCISYDVKLPQYMDDNPPPLSKGRKIPITQLEDGEITKEIWLKEKTTVLGASVLIKMQPAVDLAELSLKPDPTKFALIGNPEGAGADCALPNDETNIFAQYVLMEDGSHVINFNDNVTEELLLYILSSVYLEQRGAPKSVSANEETEVSFICKVKFPHPTSESSFVDADFSFRHILKFVKPILKIPPEQTQVSYTEGDGDASFWRHLDIEKRTPSLYDAVVTLRLLPYRDIEDYLSLYTKSGISYNEDYTRILFNGIELGVIVELGALRLPKTKPERKKAEKQETLIRLRPSATADGVAALIRCCVFRNDSENPVEGIRTFTAGITFLTGFSSFVNLTVELIGEDDPTVIDFGLHSIPYRLDPSLPEQHEQYLMDNKCYFASAANVFDVDTTDFSGGSLSVHLDSQSKSKDSLDVIPLPDSNIEIKDDGTVLFKQSIIGKVVATEKHLEFTFQDSSIEAVQALFNCFTFQSSMSTVPTTPQPRTIQCTFVCGETAPVRAQCAVKITEPLISVSTKDAFWSYKEDAGFQPLAPNFAVCMEDEGWDGGFIFVEYCEGRCEDDVLTIKESNALKLVDEENGEGSSLTAAQRMASMKLQKEASISASKSMEEEPSKGDLAKVGSMRNFSELKSIMRKRAADKVRQLREARQKAHDELRHRMLDEVRHARREIITKTMERALYLDGKRVASATISPDSIMIQFPVGFKAQNVDPSKPRVSFCSVKRKDVSSILRHISYKNVSDNPVELKKVFRIVASDGTPHRSMATVEVEIVPSEDATELRREDNSPKEFRAHSGKDLKGFCLFGDVSLFDPDTFNFNGCVTAIDLIGGGDPKGDQLGLLSVEQQRQRPRKSKSADEDFLEELHGFLTVTTKSELMVGERRLGIIHFDTAGSHTNCVIKFDSLPTDIPEAHSLEDLSTHPDVYLPITVIERVLNSIVYTNVASKVKPGTRIFQARVGMKGVEGKIKVNVDVEGPLLWNPGFGNDLRYKENQPPLAVFPKISINFNEKTICKNGSVGVRLVDGQEEEDVLSVVLSRDYQKDYSVQKDCLYYGKDTYIGAIEKETSGSVQLVLDWSSKATAKHLQAFLRCVCFSNPTDDPSTDARKVEAFAMFGPMEHDPFYLSTFIDVIAEDDPTEIILPTTNVHIVREGPSIFLTPDGEIQDPDTPYFLDADYMEVEMKNCQIASDKLMMDGMNLDTQSDIYRETGPDPTEEVSSKPTTPGKSSTSPPAAEKAKEKQQPEEQKPEEDEEYSQDENENEEGADGSSLQNEKENEEGEEEKKKEEAAEEKNEVPSPATAGGRKVIAHVKLSSKTGALHIQLCKGCRLDELQDLILRKLKLKLLKNSKDKATKKIIQLSVKTGTSPVFRTSLGVECLPSLFELPEKLQTDGVFFKVGLMGHIDLFPQVAIGTGNFLKGATIFVALAETGLPHSILLSASSKHGIAVKETRDQPCDSVLLDGKKVAEVKQGGKNTLNIDIPEHPQISNVIQRILRSIAFDSNQDLSDPIFVNLRVTDLEKPLSLSASIRVSPIPGK